MSTSTTLAAYAAGLAVVFAAAVGVGSAVGPIGAGPSSGSASDAPHGLEHAPDGSDATTPHGGPR